MKLRSLRLENFRNIAFAELELGEGINVFTGQNGHGKTSVLEAISLLASLRSFRSGGLSEFTQREKEYSRIETLLQSSDYSFQTQLSIHIQCPVSEGRPRRLALMDNKPVRSVSEYIRKLTHRAQFGFHVVSFNPSDHDLVKGDPKGRRSYLDHSLGSHEPGHIDLLLRFQKALEQRNSSLKSHGANMSGDLFLEPIIALGSQIARARLSWLKSWYPYFIDALREIAPNQVIPELKYQASWMSEQTAKTLVFDRQSLLPPIEQLDQDLRQKAHRIRAAELEAGLTLFGPQRDDWGFWVLGQELRHTGSQGEIRSVLLAMKLAEIRLFEAATEVRAALILDDLSSELDEQRRRFLLRMLGETQRQVFVTTTDDKIGLQGRHFRLNEGEIRSAYVEVSQLTRGGDEHRSTERVHSG